MNAERDSDADGVCPAATEAIVFSDTSGGWIGRYRDDANQVHDIPLPAKTGDNARRLLAQYLGVVPMSVRIIEVHYKSRRQDE